jgi:phosphatidylglycerol:prolipoprotein diacylglycerol transferase
MIDLFAAIPFPKIDPVLFSWQITDGFAITVRYYALAYILGLLFAWWYVRKLCAGRPKGQEIMTGRDIDDLLFWSTLGVVLGGRLGYVLFYRPGFYLENPDQILSIWRGGMSFHGGLLGVIIAIVVFSKVRKIRMLSVGDLAACATPVGLFLGRCANFINGELWGRKTDLPWGMVFPTGGPDPRHPSQLYEALLEGLLLFFLLLFWRRRTGALSRPGELGGLFLIGYGAARFIVEYARQPDAFMPNDGFLFGFITMGQILSLPVMAVGLFLMLRARRLATRDAAGSGNAGSGNAGSGA